MLNVKNNPNTNKTKKISETNTFTGTKKKEKKQEERRNLLSIIRNTKEE